jgi:hypothetical protein
LTFVDFVDVDVEAAAGLSVLVEFVPLLSLHPTATIMSVHSKHALIG